MCISRNFFFPFFHAQQKIFLPVFFFYYLFHQKKKMLSEPSTSLVIDNEWMTECDSENIFLPFFFSLSGWKCTNECAEVTKNRERILREILVPLSSPFLPPSYFLLLNDDNNSNDEREYVNIWKDICICCLDFVCLWPFFFDVSTLDNPPITVHTYMCTYLCENSHNLRIW